MEPAALEGFLAVFRNSVQFQHIYPTIVARAQRTRREQCQRCKQSEMFYSLRHIKQTISLPIMYSFPSLVTVRTVPLGLAARTAAVNKVRATNVRTGSMAVTRPIPMATYFRYEK